MAACRPSRSTSSSRPARSPSWAPTTARPAASAAPRSGKYAKDQLGLRLHGLRVARVDRRRCREHRPHGRLARRLQGVLPDPGRQGAHPRRRGPDRPGPRADDQPAGRPPGRPDHRRRDQRGRHPRRDRRRQHARSPDRPLLRRPGHRSLHLEGHRLQPELHRLRGVLPGALRHPAHPEHGQGAPGRDDPRGDLHRARSSSTRTTSGRSTRKRRPADASRASIESAA